MGNNKGNNKINSSDYSSPIPKLSSSLKMKSASYWDEKYNNPYFSERDFFKRRTDEELTEQEQELQKYVESQREYLESLPKNEPFYNELYNEEVENLSRIIGYMDAVRSEQYVRMFGELYE